MSFAEGTILIAVPHMDDEVLACGATIAQLPNKENVHLLYVTDGASSPAPPFPFIDAPFPGLSAMRMEESRAALRILGVPENNLHFLGLPERKLLRKAKAYTQSLKHLMKALNPDHVWIPFRYDRHPDHLAVNRLTMNVIGQMNVAPQIWEYFVYFRWHLLPGGDIRKYIRSDQLFSSRLDGYATIKDAALHCFTSQITRLARWQERPILTQKSMDEVCSNPEFFLKYDSSFPGLQVFTHSRFWIYLVHAAETPLKRTKDSVRALGYHAIH